MAICYRPLKLDTVLWRCSGSFYDILDIRMTVSLAVKKAKDHREILQGHTHTHLGVLFSSLLWRKMFLIVNAPLSLLPSLSNALLLTLLPFFCRTISWMASYFLLCLKINLSNYIHQWNKKSEVNLWEVIGKDFSSQTEMHFEQKICEDWCSWVKIGCPKHDKQEVEELGKVLRWPKCESYEFEP